MFVPPATSADFDFHDAVPGTIEKYPLNCYSLGRTLEIHGAAKTKQI